MHPLTEAEALLRGAVDDGLASAWQLTVVGPTGRVDAAAGIDAVDLPVDEASRFSTYCAIKPLLAVAAAAAVDDGELSWHDRVAHLVPGAGRRLGRCTIRSLLDHSSGAVQPDAVRATTLPGPDRVATALASEPRELAPARSAYSEAAAWIVAGAAVAAAVGDDLRAFVIRRVLEPLGCAGEFDLGDRPAPDGRHRMNLSVRTGRRWPILLERTASLAWATNPGYGGRASVRGLVALAAETVAAANGCGAVLSTEVAGELLRPGPGCYDTTWARECRFGAGWQVDLTDHRFGPSVSRDSFGHVGLVGMTATWAEPSLGIAAGYHLNGVSDGATAIDWLRSAIVSAVRRDGVAAVGAVAAG